MRYTNWHSLDTDTHCTEDWKFKKKSQTRMQTDSDSMHGSQNEHVQTD